MSDNATKPREFWISISNNNGNAVHVSNKPFVDKSKFHTDLHVIEKSAYDALQKQLEESKKRRIFAENSSVIRNTRYEKAKEEILNLSKQLDEAKAEIQRLESEILFSKNLPCLSYEDVEPIHAAARLTYRKFINSARGQAITAADSYENHLIWAAQHSERLKLEAENTRLREVAKFYADKRNWVRQQSHGDPETHWKIHHSDCSSIGDGFFGGEKAREALKKEGGR